MLLEEIMFGEGKLKLTKNPNSLTTKCLTAHPIRIICILATFQIIPTVSSFHLGLVSDKGVVNIQIKSEAPLDIAINFDSTNFTISGKFYVFFLLAQIMTLNWKFSDTNGLIYNLDETTTEQMETTTSNGEFSYNFPEFLF